ncbi:MAG: bifunctional serine/threonine-protein kinase/formylglycine-generating enzyme family protein [Acidobacteriota bacterium]
MQRIEKYELIAEIGRGSMGVVYKAFHPHLKKYVAIKEIRAEIAEDHGIRRRFEQEAQLLAQLPAHPNIVTVRDALEWQGRLYLVIDFIEGGNLSQAIQRGPVELQRAVIWLKQILFALETIHQRGIVHRDIKPGNILIDREGTAYVSDFGIAEGRELHRGVADAHNQDAAPMATVQYAAPELLEPLLSRGGSASQADLYAVGVLAYEMLLGAARFRQVFAGIYQDGTAGASSGVNAAGVNAVAARWMAWHVDLSRAAPLLQEVDARIPKPLATLVGRLMAKDVNDRYRSAAEARNDLSAFMKAASGSVKAGDARMNSDYDDATVRLDHVRGSQPVEPPGGRSPHGGNAAPPSRHSGRPGRRFPGNLPWWAKLAAVAGALLFVLILIPWVLQREPGFTLVVKGAPPDSVVIVGGDNATRGIPGNEGAQSIIRVHGLKPDEKHFLCVSCNGGAATLREVKGDGTLDGDNRVSGKAGGVVEVTAICGQPAAPKALVTILSEDGKKMRFVPAGKFLMGEDGADPKDGPQHEEDITYDYYIDQYEVTNREYQKFCEASKHPLPPPPEWEKQYPQKYPTAPVVGVSWEDAKAYADWAGKQLPTEAEWEKAASWDPSAKDAATRKRRWPWGNSPDQGKATCMAEHPTSEGQNQTGESAYGVQDMAGNVAEWVADFFQPYTGNKTPNPRFGNTERVVRGGFFATTNLDSVRTTLRNAHAPTYSPSELNQGTWVIGFRCAVRADNQRLKKYLLETGQAGSNDRQTGGCSK